MSVARHERVAGQLRRLAASLIWGEVKDPRLGSVSVTDVEVSRDLSYATIYVASADPESMPQSLKVLKSAAGFLRRRVGQELKLRAVPELRFVHDDSLERGDHIEQLLHKIRQPD